MQEIKDCKGRLACKYDESTGIIESSYKRAKARTKLSPGNTFTVEREDTITEVSISDNHQFLVHSKPRT